MNPQLQQVIEELFSYYEDYEIPSYYEENSVSIDRKYIVYMFDDDQNLNNEPL